MKASAVPYEKTVFVCTHVREDGRAACGNPGRGGVGLCLALKEGVKAAGLKKKIRVARSGCLDRCAEGPNVFVYPSGRWYSEVRAGEAEALLKELTQP